MPGKVKTVPRVVLCELASRVASIPAPFTPGSAQAPPLLVVIAWLRINQTQRPLRELLVQSKGTAKDLPIVGAVYIAVLHYRDRLALA
jgi:hypothetical protein